MNPLQNINKDHNIISAVFTSKNRKVQIESHASDQLDNVQQETDERASTANNALSSKGHSKRRPVSQVGNRPSTHEGMAPLPPEGIKTRTFRTISPRQISLKLMEPGSMNNPEDHSRPSTTPQVQIPIIIETNTPAESASSGIAMDKQFDPKMIDSILPSFIKPTKAQNPQKFEYSNFKTQYPSLGHRLVAKSGVDPNFIDNQSLPTQVSLRPKTTIPKGKNKLSNLIQQTSQQRDSNNGKQNTEDDINSTASTIEFNSMNLEDAITYLLIQQETRDPNQTLFFHVSPRYNVEKINRINFYDLVILERPGYPSSGYVWSADHASDWNVPKHPTLKPSQIMQLSLRGLLIYHEDQNMGELISIRDFLLEKEQFDFLRTGRFFGLFKEIKAFNAWKNFTQQNYIFRMRKMLSKNTFFSDIELVRALVSVGKLLFEMEKETELFYFHGHGSICISDYITQQLQRFDEVKQNLFIRVNDISKNIVDQYDAYLQSEKLAQLIEDVKSHHPLRDEMVASNSPPSSRPISRPATAGVNRTKDLTFGNDQASVDWSRLHSIQRLRDNFKEKIHKILIVTQYRIGYKLSCIIAKFWLRLKAFVIGIPTVRGNRAKSDMNYWDLPEKHFDKNGNVLEEAYEFNQHLENIPSKFHQQTPEPTATKTSTSISGGNNDNNTTSHEGNKEESNTNINPGNIGNKLTTDGHFVTKEWEQIGSHLSIEVHMHYLDRYLEIKDLINIASIDKIRVQITPQRSTLLNSLHQICGHLGSIFEFLPNLRNHPMILNPNLDISITANKYAANQPYSHPPNMIRNSHDFSANISNAQNDAVELSNHVSTNYFSFLFLNPIYNTKNNYQLAIDTMRMVFLAYEQASNIENFIHKLNEVNRKLWNLRPVATTKQIERSFTLPKIKDFIETPDMVEDLRRSSARDKNRLIQFKSISEYLSQLPKVLVKFQNIKHILGMVTSFRPVLEQLHNYRLIQEYYLYSRLSTTFITRCSIFYDFIRKLETSFDYHTILQGTGNFNSHITSIATALVSLAGKNSLLTTQQLSLVMNKLHLIQYIQNFESIKEFYDYETEICNTIYQIISHHQTYKQSLLAMQHYSHDDHSHRSYTSTVNSSLSNEESERQLYIQEFGLQEISIENMMSKLSSANHSKHRSATSSNMLAPDKLNKVFSEAQERLTTVLSLSRSYLLTQLQEIKHEVMIQKQMIHSQIIHQIYVISQHNLINNDISILDMSDYMNKFNKRVNELRKISDESLTGQLVLLQAHDIIGAANPILSAYEVDRYDDMNTLEDYFKFREKAWKIIQDVDTLKRHVLESKLGNNNIMDLNSKYIKLLWMYHDIKTSNITFQTKKIVQENFMSLQIGKSHSFLENSMAPALSSIGKASSLDMMLIQEEMKENPASYMLIDHDNLLLRSIEEMLLDLVPKIEIVSCLGSKTLRPRHWDLISKKALSYCGLDLKFTSRNSEMVSVYDITNREPVLLGNVNRLPANELLNRGVEKHLIKIRNVTSEAVIESFIEQTLETIEETFRVAYVQLSTNWLKDNRIREKIFTEIHQMTNLIPLQIMTRYCYKALVVVENTTQDLYLPIFQDRIEYLKDYLYKINKFLYVYYDVQYLWYYLLYYMKFINLRNEIDRDSIRIFNNCTEEIKKIETVFLQKNGNIHSIFLPYQGIGNFCKEIQQQFQQQQQQQLLIHQQLIASSSHSPRGNQTNTQNSLPPSPTPNLPTPMVKDDTESHVVMYNLDSTKSNLYNLLDDIDNILQSLIDSSPRLSLLSYNILLILYKQWLLGPQTHIESISIAFREMFEGVGQLTFVMIPSEKAFSCTGFVSYSKHEQIVFPENIPFSLSLDEFVKAFEMQIRLYIQRACDVLILHRIKCFQGIVLNHPINLVLENMSILFTIRYEQCVQYMLSHIQCNMNSLILINLVCHAEDVWFCLGHPTGSLALVRPDILHDNELIGQNWQENLTNYLKVVKSNIRTIQDYFLASNSSMGASSFGMKQNETNYMPTKVNTGGINQRYDTNIQPTKQSKQKERSIYINLLLYEMQFLHQIEDILKCTTLMSALELWASKYQLRFQYHKEQRYRFSPLDVTLGNISIPYGMEYHETGAASPDFDMLDYALNHTLSSSFNLHGAAIIHTNSVRSVFPNLEDKEFPITGKDIAYALGRICITMPIASNPLVIRYFLGRILYLDAIGCIDFTTITSQEFSLLLQQMQHQWSAIENKNDSYLQDSLKCPLLHHKYVRNELHNERKKLSITELRNNINFRKENNHFVSFLCVGFASESVYHHISTFDYFTHSIFNPITIQMTYPMEKLGKLLFSRGYIYGMDIQACLMSAIEQLVYTYKNSSGYIYHVYSSFPKLFSTKGITALVNDCRLSLELAQHSVFSHLFTSSSHKVQKRYPNIHVKTGNNNSNNSTNSSYEKTKQFEKIYRFKMEMICFCANLWEHLLKILNSSATGSFSYEVDSSTSGIGKTSGGSSTTNSGANSNIPRDTIEFAYEKLRLELYHYFIKQLELVLTPSELLEFQKNSLSVDGLTYRSDLLYIILMTAQQSGYLHDSNFINYCLSLLHTLTQVNSLTYDRHNNTDIHRIVVLSGMAGSGKSAVRDTVIKAMQRFADKRHIVYNNTKSWPILIRISARRIFYYLYRWYQYRLKVKKWNQIKEEEMKKMQLNEAANPESTSTNVQKEIELEKVQNEGLSTEATQRPSIHPQISSKDFSSSNITGKKKKERFTDTSLSAKLGIGKVSLIYHASMSTNSLIGSFDSSGKWNDGILLRKIRQSSFQSSEEDTQIVPPSIKKATEDISNQFLPNISLPPYPTLNEAKYDGITNLIILNGPITYPIEQLLHGMMFQSLSDYVVSHYTAPRSNRLIFPTSEYFRIHTQTKFIIETNDLSHASPLCLSILPIHNINFTIEVTYKRLLKSWLRSLTHWLGDFPPWFDFLDEIKHLLLKTKFVEDLLYDDIHNVSASLKAPSKAIILSKVSTFLRILEELLLQIHQLALPLATFSVPTEKESSSSSSSSEDEDENETNDRPSFLKTIGKQKSSMNKRKSHGNNVDILYQHSNRINPEDSSSKYYGIMSLNPKGRELLNKRGRLAIIYSALWGFGGNFNSTDRKKFFENMIRELIHIHFQNGGDDLSINHDISLFDSILDIEECQLKPAYQYDQRTKKIVTNPGLNEKHLDSQVYADLIQARVEEALYSNYSQYNDRLVFRSPSTRAVASIFRLLLKTGANVFIFGSRNSGKTRIILEELTSLQENCLSPDQIRQQIADNLIKIVNGSSNPEGIFKVLQIIQSVLLKSAKYAVNSSALTEDYNKQKISLDDNNTQNNNGDLFSTEVLKEDFTEYWNLLEKELNEFSASSPRQHCNERTITSAVTSIKSFSGAGQIRSWFEREFASETKHVLESSRFTYGIAFIDDMHYLAEDAIDNHDVGDSSRIIEDKQEELIKGLVNSYQPFTMKRRVTVRSPGSMGFHNGSDFGEFEVQQESQPILHKDVYMDMRLPLLQSDDFVVRSIGLVGALTGHASESINTDSIQRIIGQFSMISLPSFSSTELHVALIAGALVSMNSSIKDFSILDVLKNEIFELSRITMLVCHQKMISNADLALTTSIERTLRACTLFDISNVSKFCLSLRYGSVHIHNPGSLLQLYVHEWKRFFIDPLPEGSQRDRILHLLNEQLDTLDEKSWSVKRDWMIGLKDELNATIDRVWIDTRTLKPDNSLMRHSIVVKPSPKPLTIPNIDPSSTIISEEIETTKLKNFKLVDNNDIYSPVDFEALKTEKYIKNGIFNVDTGTYESVLTIDQITESKIDKFLSINEFNITNKELRGILYPAALSLLLRMVRILSTAGKHLLLTGFPGGSRLTSLYLAAKICDLQPFVYSTSGDLNVLEVQASEKTLQAFDFKEYLKGVILRTLGLSDPVYSSPSTSNSSPYEDSNSTSNFLMNNIGMNANNATFISYEIIQPKKCLMIIESSQHLTEDERLFLSHLIEYNDGSRLFNDMELLGIADALRQSQKIAMQSKIEIEESVIEDQENNVKLSPLSHQNLMRTSFLQQMMTNQDTNAGEGIITEENSSPETFKGIPPIITSNFQAQSSITTNATPPLHLSQVKNLLTGYTYHWITKHISGAIQQYLHITLIVEVTRPMELDSKLFLSSQEALSSLRKLSGINSLHQKKANKPMNSSQPEAQKDSAFQSKKSQRYSILSNRSEKGSFMGTKIFNPTVGVSLGSGNIEDNQSEPGAVVTPITLPISLQSLFTCPIVGPLLMKYFQLIWYEIDSHDATKGVCNLLMKNDTSVILNSSMKSLNIFRPFPFETELGILNANLLCLRSSDVGDYHMSDVTASSESKDSNINKPSRRLSLREKEAFEFQEKRKTRFKAFSKLKSYNLAIQGLPDPNFAFYNITSVIQNFGVFQSYSLPPELVNHDVNALLFQQLAFYIEESRVILPYLLTLPLPSDGLLLLQPLFTIGPEEIAHRSSDLIMYIMQSGCMQLLMSKYIIEFIGMNYQEIIHTLNNSEEMDQKLVQSNDDLYKKSRFLSKELDLTRKELDLIPSNFKLKYIEYEHQLLIEEDLFSSKYRIDTFQSQCSSILQIHFNKLNSFTSQEWQMFSLFYSNKPYPKPFIDVMRSIMVLINFVPPKHLLKSAKKEEAKEAKEAKELNKETNKDSNSNPQYFSIPGLNVKMDDDLVAKCSILILMKHQDMVYQLVNLSPDSLNSSQVTALKVMNTILNTNITSSDPSSYASISLSSATGSISLYHSFIQSDELSITQKYKNYQDHFFNDSQAHPIYDTLRQILINYELLLEAKKYSDTEGMEIERKQIELQKTQEKSQLIMKDMADEINDKMNNISYSIQKIDSSIIENRKKLDTIEKNNNRKNELIEALKHSQAYLSFELQQINSILQDFVYDLCCFVVILFRAGWLPDAIRQECYLALRQGLVNKSLGNQSGQSHTQKNNLFSPFLSGCLLDRFQIHQWYSGYQINPTDLHPLETTISNNKPQPENSRAANSRLGKLSTQNDPLSNINPESWAFTKDIPNINTLSLLYLSPFYSLVIDPDGTSLNVIQGTVPSGYECHVISGQKFTLPVFENWVDSLYNHSDNIDDPFASLNGPNQGTIDSLPENKTPSLFLIITDIQSGVSEDLLCLLSSKLDYYHAVHQSMNSEVFPEDPLLPTPEINPIEHNSTIYEFSFGFGIDNMTSGPFSNSYSGFSKKRIRIPQKFRLVLISTKQVVFDGSGKSYPLPLPCLKNITIIYWGNCQSEHAIVESKPIQNSLNQHYLSDHTLTHHMTIRLLRSIKPQFIANLTKSNKLLVSTIAQLLVMEKQLYLNIYTWLMGDKEHRKQLKKEQDAVDADMYSDDDSDVEENSSNDLLNTEGLSEITQMALSILSNEDIVHLLLQSRLHRDQLQSYILSSRLSFREQLTYLSSVEESFTMGSQLIQMCRSILPFETTAPYSLATSSITNNLIGPMTKFIMKNKQIYKLPDNLTISLKVWRAIKSLQEIFRRKKFPHLVSKKIKISDYLITYSLHTKNSKGKKNTFNLKSLSEEEAQKDSKTNVIHDIILPQKEFGLIPSYRAKAQQLIHYKLIAVRQYFVREVYRYIQLNVQPGFEDILKYCLWLTSLYFGPNSTHSANKPGGTLPSFSEIKALNSFLLQSKGYSIKRYCYVYPIKPPNFPLSSSSNDSQQNSSPSMMLKGHANAFQKAMQNNSMINMHHSMLRKGRRKSSVGNSANDSVIMNRKASSARKYDSTTLRSDDTSIQEDHFLEALPNTSTFNRRLTAFRKLQTDFDKHPDGGILPAYLKKNDDMNINGKKFTNIWVEKLVERGPGVPDGLWFNSTNSNWILTRERFKSNSQTNKEVVNYDTERACGILLFLDENLKIEPKLSLLSLNLDFSIHYQDAYEVEWLKIQGIRSFSTINSLALSALGATPKILEEIHQLRQTMALQQIGNISSNNKLNRRKSSAFRTSISAKPKTIGPPPSSRESGSQVSALRRKSSLHVGVTKGSLISSASTKSTNKKAERRLSTRVSTLLDGISQEVQRNRRSSIRTSTLFAPTPLNFVGNRRASAISIPGVPAYNSAGDFTELLTCDQAYLNLLILETHPQLSSIFRGISSGIGRNLNDFLDWRDALHHIKDYDIRSLDPSELVELIQSIQPPRCTDLDNADSHVPQSTTASSNIEDGLWAKGLDLTVIQSLLLCSALWPNTPYIQNYFQAIFVFISEYLKNDGYILIHPDETIVFDEDEDDRENDDDEDSFDSNLPKDRKKSGLLSDSANVSSPSKLDNLSLTVGQTIVEHDDEESEEENEDKNEKEEKMSLDTTKSRPAIGKARSTFFQALDEYSNSLRNIRQDQIHPMNSWYALEDSMADGKLSMFPMLLSDFSDLKTSSISKSRTQITFRDHFNWEQVLIDTIGEPPEIDKFVYMKELRDNLLGSYKTTYFLTPYRQSNHVAILSHNARELSLQTKKHVPIISCAHFNPNDSIIGSTSSLLEPGNNAQNRKFLRSQLHDLLKLIKSSIMSIYAKKVILEKLDLHSNIGNSILYSTLLSASTASKNTTTLPIATSSSTPNTQHSQPMNEVTSSTPTTSGLMVSNSRTHSKETYPLVITSIWGKTVDNSYFTSTLESNANTLNESTTLNIDAPKEDFYRISPPIVMGEINYAWLPRYFSPDIISILTNPVTDSKAEIHSHNHHSRPPQPPLFQQASQPLQPRPPSSGPTGDHPAIRKASMSLKSSQPSISIHSSQPLKISVTDEISVSESCGVLYEELESVLLWVTNSFQSLLHTRITSQIRVKLRHAQKIAIRSTAAIIAIYQLIQYSRCIQFDHSEEQGSSSMNSMWSLCLNRLTLWQLSRLIVKVNDFFQLPWLSNLTENEKKTLNKEQLKRLVIQDSLFHVNVKLILESFSSLNFNLYGTLYSSQPKNNQTYKNDFEVSQISKADTSSVDLDSLSQNKSTISEVGTTGYEKLIQLVNKHNALNSANSWNIKSTPTHLHGEGPSSPAVPAAGQRIRQMKSMRAEKQWKKSWKKVEEARSEYLAQLLQINVEHNKDKSPILELPPLISNTGKTVPINRTPMIADQIDNDNIQRFNSFASHFLAEAIVTSFLEAQANLVSNTAVSLVTIPEQQHHNDSDSLSKDRKYSHKLNISTVLSTQQMFAIRANALIQSGKVSSTGTRHQSQGLALPIFLDINKLDIKFGKLLPEDMLLVILQWSFNQISSHTSAAKQPATSAIESVNSNTTSDSVDRKKVLHLIKRLSEHILMGKVAYQFNQNLHH